MVLAKIFILKIHSVRNFTFEQKGIRIRIRIWNHFGIDNFANKFNGSQKRFLILIPKSETITGTISGAISGTILGLTKFKIRTHSRNGSQNGSRIRNPKSGTISGLSSGMTRKEAAGNEKAISRFGIEKSGMVFKNGSRYGYRSRSGTRISHTGYRIFFSMKRYTVCKSTIRMVHTTFEIDLIFLWQFRLN